MAKIAFLGSGSTLLNLALFAACETDYNQIYIGYAPRHACGLNMAGIPYEQELYDTATGINSPFLEAKQDFYDIQAEFYEREPEQVNPGLMDPAGNVPVDIPAALEVRDEVVEEWIEQQHAPDVIQETVSSLENPSMWGPNAQGTWSPEEEEEEIAPGIGWDPMGLTNLLGDQIGLINELAQAGILNAQEWQATTMDTIDGIWGDLQGF